MPRSQTQFEAFLSLRTVTANGLESTLEDERRCVIKGIHNAFDNIDKNIIDMWANKMAEVRTTSHVYGLCISPARAPNPPPPLRITHTHYALRIFHPS